MALVLRNALLELLSERGWVQFAMDRLSLKQVDQCREILFAEKQVEIEEIAALTSL
jgi:hypothetical protein